jgi:metal-responsive CopG/Arc/MetJ family transcriptional regulator
MYALATTRRCETMPTEKGDKQAVTIWIDKGLVDRLEVLAAKGDITRSKLITNLVKSVQRSWKS